LREAQKTSPLTGLAIDALVDFTPHRDYLATSTVTYK
jgi:hypothetical protein